MDFLTDDDHFFTELGAQPLILGKFMDDLLHRDILGNNILNAAGVFLPGVLLNGSLRLLLHVRISFRLIKEQAQLLHDLVRCLLGGGAKLLPFQQLHLLYEADSIHMTVRSGLLDAQSLHQPAVLLRCNLQGFFAGFGPLESTAFQPLVQEQKTGALP